MISKPAALLLGMLCSASLAIVSYTLGLESSLLAPVQSAAAKDGNGNGNNGGNGNSGGNGGGNGGAGNSGAGKGANTGGQNRAGLGSTGSPGGGGVEAVNPATGRKSKTYGAIIEVIHRNGIKEQIGNGRYEMRDSKGRTIVNRPATITDRARLRAIAGL